MNILDFNKEIIIENDRVLLRPLQENDFDILVTFALTEPNLWQYSLVSANSEERMMAYIKKALSERNAESSYPFIVFDKKTEEYAGSTRFYNYNGPHKTAELGYTWYGKRFWATGLNKNCKYLLLQYAFEKLDLARVEFKADNSNERSIAAMKSLGCIEEGILRSHTIGQNGRRDSIVLSILQEEWLSVVRENLKKRI